jgi:hypothetical protein
MKLVCSGSSFKLWSGSRGQLRLDWTPKGAVRTTIKGHGHGEFAPHVVQQWTETQRAVHRIVLIIDVWDMITYDSQLRSELQGWAINNRIDISRMTVAAQSKMVKMGTAVANLALGGFMHVHPTIEALEVESRRHGLEMRPSMTA